MNFKNKSIISIRDMNRSEIDYIIKSAEILQDKWKNYTNSLKDRILGTLFFEPSTRTRISFETAMKRLGGMVVGFSAPEGSSLAKGENLIDTVRVVENYCDAIVLRHPLEGAARLAAKYVKIPVINAGTGAEEHPTQALLDLYTIFKEKGGIDGLNIALLGDLKYGRTIHSLTYALSNYKVKLTLVSPPLMKIREEIIEDLRNKKIEVTETSSLDAVINELDVLYVTRIQRERFADPTEYERVKGSYRIDLKILKSAKKDLIIMHPLPRLDEISQDVDATNHAVYFKQVKYGLIVRMAILLLIFGFELI
ncbi:MAG: aspartate carbamoyltransferase [Candidatus Odinarchaeum yellowstonii]|jgi:aspartate carbamoyltransferase catalytic subunit|uniref:Aspartate carbamoyltransferase n=1 Tax=Odinarchaeota yellowstonii (strain LCB_4) TaxID=1841599 RepID=A0AAF0D3H5_ODILC|nr:MAG: aspartate carbamoyltransferase [Candidatus Odinarchaeum yellowstonii]